MSELLCVLVGLAAGFGIGALWTIVRRLRTAPGAASATPDAEPAADSERTSAAEPDADAGDEASDDHDASRGPELYAIAARLGDFYRQTAHPIDLLDHADFERGCELLAELSGESLRRYVGGDSQILACMASEVLRRGEGEIGGDVVDRVVDSLEEASNWARFFALRLLKERVDATVSVVPRVLGELETRWDTALAREFVADFVRARQSRRRRSRVRR